MNILVIQEQRKSLANGHENDVSFIMEHKHLLKLHNAVTFQKLHRVITFDEK